MSLIDPLRPAFTRGQDLVGPEALQSGAVDKFGAGAFLRFGYSALGLTPAKGVTFRNHFLEPGVNDFGLRDPGSSSASDAVEAIRAWVQDWEDAQNGLILLPLSGGFDSRLLAWCLKDRDRVIALSYGISPKQRESFEVVIAKEVASRLGIRHEFLELRKIHAYVPFWYRNFGISVHLHGMYHMEFYSQARHRFPEASSVLSGIFGDIWSGKVVPKPVTDADTFAGLALNHGVGVDPADLAELSAVFELIHETYVRSGASDWSVRDRIVGIWFFKSMLLRYLVEVPSLEGFAVGSPFLEVEIVQTLLALAPQEWEKRLWQHQFFESQNLAIPEGGKYANTLNLQAHAALPGPELHRDYLAEFVRPSLIDSVNRNLFFLSSYLRVPREILRRRQWAYNKYVVLAALQLYGLGPSHPANQLWFSNAEKAGRQIRDS